jgi:hypothetical protein
MSTADFFVCSMFALCVPALIFWGIAYGMAYKAAYENYMRILNNPPKPPLPPKMPND